MSDCENGCGGCHGCAREITLVEIDGADCPNCPDCNEKLKGVAVTKSAGKPILFACVRCMTVFECDPLRAVGRMMVTAEPEE